MRRVVITGLGVVSSIGNNAAEVLTSLKAGKSGITANADMQEHGFRSQVAGSVDLDIREHVDKRVLRFMGPGAAYAFLSMQQAIADAGLEESDISNPRTDPSSLVFVLHFHFVGFIHLQCPTQTSLKRTSGCYFC